MSDHWINRYRHNKLIWWICVILQLWIITWPLLIFMTKRWEVLTVEWPRRIYMEPDGSWPMAHELSPGGMTYEGQETGNPSERVAYMTEQDWVRQWRQAVQLAAESKKRGTLSVGDWRIAQEVEERFRQRAAGRSAAGQDSGILAAATGLLSGVQGFVAQSQRASGWGGNSRRRRLIREHGCNPIKNSSELNPWKDALFGWTQLAINRKAAKQRNLLEYSRGRFLRNGYTIHSKFGFDNIVFTVEPENLKTMLATKFHDWNLPDRRKAAFYPLLGNGIFTSDGAPWQHSRELLRPNFVRSQVADLATFETHVEHLIQSIPRDGSTVDLRELFFRLTIDSATEFLFGESTNCLAPGASSAHAAEFANAFDRSQEAAGKASRGLPFVAKLFPASSISKDIRYVHQFVDHYVKLGLEWQKKQDAEKSESESGERYIFLYELVKAVQDPIRIRSELLNVLLAGRDTTASLLTNVWFIMAKRPDIWANLRQEVDTLYGEQPTFEQLKDMKYLKYVLNETLRIYPVVPSNSRMSILDTVLPRGGGPDGTSPLFIPAKTTVGWSLYTMHRREDLFGEDAEEFKPERWETLRPGWEYLPFNGGPRICIGQQFALTEASYTTIRLMQEYKDIESRDREPWTECITLTASGRATKVALTPA
ncbi:MAG: hypothetical protein Q9178_002076 [Gyalolechia marmorata]